MPFRNKPEELEKFHQQMLDLIQARGHEYVSGKMTKSQNDECYIVYCPKHKCKVLIKNSELISYREYNRRRFGCLECAKERQKQASTDKIMPQSAKDTIAAFRRSQTRDGILRKFRKTSQYREWQRTVRENWGGECAITGIKNPPKGSDTFLLVTHHLYGVKLSKVLSTFPDNGIFIHREIHDAFHGLYGYNENTLDQFLEFLIKLKNKEVELDVLISSQTSPEGVGGSETRLYDPERIMKVHERLDRLKPILDDMFFKGVVDETLEKIYFEEDLEIKKGESNNFVSTVDNESKDKDSGSESDCEDYNDLISYFEFPDDNSPS